MEYITIIIISLVSMLILAWFYDFTISKIKKLKQVGFSKEIIKITNKLPENKIVCEEILKQLNNFENVKIVQDSNQNAKASLYIVATNTISIANVNKACSRIQTIAHECVHSVQDKKLLWFNFIFSNIYIIYFIIISILTIFYRIQNQMIFLYILTLFSFIYYKIRSFLETDAMTRAPYITKQYIHTSKILTVEEEKKVMDAYAILNDIGIKISNLDLFAGCIIKIIIYCVICTIVYK